MCLFAAIHWCTATVDAKDGSPGYAVTNVTLIDVENGRAVADRTVVIEGDRIRKVAPAGEAAVTVTMKRLEDTTLPGKDGMPVAVRRYASTQEVPGMGTISEESWCDGR